MLEAIYLELYSATGKAGEESPNAGLQPDVIW